MEGLGRWISWRLSMLTTRLSQRKYICGPSAVFFAQRYLTTACAIEKETHICETAGARLLKLEPQGWLDLKEIKKSRMSSLEMPVFHQIWESNFEGLPLPKAT